MSYTPLIFASYDDLKRLDEKSDILKKDTWHDTDTEDGFVLNEIRNEYLIGARFTIKNVPIIILGGDLLSYKNELTSEKEYLNRCHPNGI